ncbi:uncharacterized protein EV154DRAFT_524916 [Mucor mucedo]|uniref:Late endosomal/lysosomal adaptor and MAPK and MTOR activator 5 n=1 Tax=Mucor saturninus TaxID=64648 RepID=A0A8H7QRA8_9FUNG|nr:uncharacterized protein EV154DRAFT_524916 [Mucor mucedo]KAG2196350.1 hypothetical protein INT47_010785 [Mucor saturninus]KAI7878716.1 hypothetical protein EV154DRAFT_524916 [Mucor mucedo]
MESELISTLDNLANKEGVKGVLVADEKGLCLGVRGIAKPETAAFITSLANTARHLEHTHEDKVECPTMNVEYENNQIVIRNEGTFTLAIFM